MNRDVAQLYGVETREINQAVSNNPDKFPKGYILDLNDEEKTIPAFNQNDPIELLGLDIREHTTKPPARYNDASLVKLMEEKGIPLGNRILFKKNSER